MDRPIITIQDSSTNLQCGALATPSNIILSLKGEVFGMELTGCEFLLQWHFHIHLCIKKPTHMEFVILLWKKRSTLSWDVLLITQEGKLLQHLTCNRKNFGVVFESCIYRTHIFFHNDDFQHILAKRQPNTNTS